MGLTNNLGKLSNMITSTGSAVGIGTASPASGRKLTVAGGAQFTYGDNTGASFNIVPNANGQDGADFNLSYYTGTGYGPLTFTLGGSERMRITSAGLVGIGTSSPNVPLAVVGGDSTYPTANGTIVAGSTSSIFHYYNRGTVEASGTSSALFGMTVNANACGYLYHDGTNYNLNNYISGGAMTFGTVSTERMRITSGGAVLIGTTVDIANQPSINIGGAGSSYFTVYNNYSGNSVGLEMTNNANTLKVQFFGSSGNYYFAGSNISDRRSKSNIQQITEGLSKISQLKPSTFTYDKNPDIVKGGFIAQEVLEVMPEFVTIPEDENEMMGVDYFGILALAVKSIQELEARLKTLENK